jgi:hypothetical protein
MCSTCLVDCHRNTQTHRIQTWDNSSWINDNLSREDLGYVLYLGHYGKPCPSNEESWNLHVGDLNGFMPIRVRYCTCNSTIPVRCQRRHQLLAAGLFPCSHIHPQSALTFPLLEVYDLLTTVGRTSGHKFYSVLAQFTQPSFPGKVDDRYCELLWTHQRYLYLLQLWRLGHKFPPHPDVDIHPGNQAVDCVACPHPGVNFEWAEVSHTEWCAYALRQLSGIANFIFLDRQWFRLWFSYDGNFRSVQKNKKYDLNNVCLSDSKAYFVLKDLYKGWTQSLPQIK